MARPSVRGDGTRTGERRGMGRSGTAVSGQPLHDQQYSPAVDAAPGGGFVVVWDSFGSVGDDTSGYSVQGRILALAPPLFEDGFESGDFQEWSDVVGAAPG